MQQYKPPLTGKEKRTLVLAVLSLLLFAVVFLPPAVQSMAAGDVLTAFYLLVPLLVLMALLLFTAWPLPGAAVEGDTLTVLSFPKKKAVSLQAVYTVKVQKREQKPYSLLALNAAGQRLFRVRYDDALETLLRSRITGQILETELTATTTNHRKRTPNQKS